jgi:Na+/serine symporter
MQDVSHAVSAIIHKVIAFAPVGIFGLVAVTFADAGLAIVVSELWRIAKPRPIAQAKIPIKLASLIA